LSDSVPIQSLCEGDWGLGANLPGSSSRANDPTHALLDLASMACLLHGPGLVMTIRREAPVTPSDGHLINRRDGGRVAASHAAYEPESVGFRGKPMGSAFHPSRIINEPHGAPFPSVPVPIRYC
jgi:hypothetical protein